MNGLALKERGQEIALFHSGEDWVSYILEKLRAFCKARKELGMPVFRFEEFREVADITGWELPKSHKAWGALPALACRRGLIRWTGQHVPAKSRKTHGHYVKTWAAL
jgi:hypothetical protein